MKRILVILTILCLTVSLFAWQLDRQAQFPVNMLGIDNYGDNVVIVGLNGAVAVSTDNGESFTFVQTATFNVEAGTYLDGNDVSFADATHVAIGSENGMVLLSSDAGQSFTVAPNVATLFGTEDIEGIIYHADGKIWASGMDGKIGYSDDHGQTWVLQTTPIGDALYGMSMNTSGTGFVSCNNGSPDSAKVLKTTNFGADWEIISLNVANNPTNFEVKQFGDGVLVLGDDGYVGYSADNGQSWIHHATAGGASEPRMYGGEMNGDIGYAVGWNGIIVKTTDAWQTTEIVENDWNYYSQDIIYDANGLLTLCGWYGTVAKSTDGINWEEKTISSVDSYSVSVIDEDNWYLVGDKATIFRTDDAGSSYTKIVVPAHAGTSISSLYASHFNDANNGVVTGKTTGVIYNTTDGGQTWNSHQVPGVSSSKSFYDIEFVTSQIGYVMGHGVVGAKTTDGGQTWNNITFTGMGSNDKIYSIHAFDENNIVVGSASGKIYRTTNGLDFSLITVGSGEVKDIYFQDDNHGVFVNDDGDIYYTSTGGLTADAWSAASESTGDAMNRIYETEAGVLFVSGESADASNLGTTWALMTSTDNGATWSEVSLPTTTFNPVRLTDMGGWGENLIVAGKNQVVYSGEVEGGTTPSEDAENLFFSEYIEGSGNNKALEIFNGTGAEIDLTAYSVNKANNGGEWGTAEPLTGMLADDDVYVISNAESDATVLAVADITSTMTYFNGDDVVGLFHNDVLIDVIGTYGEDPGAAWNVAGVNEATKEHTLVRKSTIGVGSLDWVASAGTDVNNSEWTVYEQNDFTYIGTHQFDGGGTPTNYTATPTFDQPSGSYTDAFDLVISCATDNSQIYYTVDGSDPSDSSTEYTTSINISANTVVKAIAYATDFEPSFIATASYTFLEDQDVSSIADLRAGSTDGSVYTLTTEAIMTYSQDYRNQKFVQDATGGILIDDFDGLLATAYNVGDGITGLVGTISSYNGMTQFIPTGDAGVATSTANPIADLVVPISDVTSNVATYESRLVTLNSVTFTETGNFASGQNYTLSDGANSITFRTQFYGADYIDTEIPVTPVNVTALVMQYNGTAQVASRYVTDFEPAGAIEYGSISGVITATETFTLIANATISVGTLSTTSNATGQYSLADVPVGNYSVTCSAAGYTTATVTDVEILVGANTELDFSLEESVVPTESIVINEIMYNSPSFDNEWIELYNNSANEVSLAGWSLSDNEDGHTPIVLPADATIGANGFFTIAIDHHADAVEFPFTADFDATETSDWYLGNTTEHLSILNAASELIDEVTFEDSNGWPTGADGGGSSLELNDPALDNNIPTSWHASTVAGGTPGETNSGLMQVIEVANLSELRNHVGEMDEFIVTGEVFLTYQQTFRGNKYLQDADAGILIDDNATVVTTTYNIGDGITGIRGTLSEYGGMIQFIPTLDFGDATSTENTITPVVATIAELTDDFETYEGRLVKVENVLFNAAGNFENGTVYEITDGVDTYNFRTSFYDVDYIASAIPNATGNLVAIANSRTDGEYISARNSLDIEFEALGTPENLTYNVIEDDVTLNWESPVAPTSRSKSYIDADGNVVVIDAETTRNELRNVTGYKVYKDGVEIAETETSVTTYEDQDLVNGTYEYYVTAMYDESESAASNTVSVEISGGVTPALFEDSFETYTDFALEFGSWTLVDVDLTPNYTITDIEFEHAGEAYAYMIFNPATTTPALEEGYEAHTGDKYITAFASVPNQGTTNNDWIISQSFTLDQEGTVSFWAKTLTDQYGLERFNVLVSNGSTNPDDFTSISGTTYVEAPTAWTEFSYSLNEYAGETINVALQCVSNDAFIFMVDDFKVVAPNATGDGTNTNQLVATELTGNYPNPFNPETTISFNMKEAGDVTVEIFNLKGQKVTTLVKGNKSSGTHSVVWNGKDDSNNSVSSGVYFYKMKSGKYSKTKKMILMK